MTSPIDDAFARALAAIDDAMGLVRELQSRPGWSVDTLSSSLANPSLDPRADFVEAFLRNARIVIHSAADAEAIVAIAKVCAERGLLTGVAAVRLIADCERA